MSELTDEQQRVKGNILEFIAGCAEEGDFPEPEHEDMDFAGWRMHAMHSAETFALVFEQMVFYGDALRIQGDHGFRNQVFVYSNDSDLNRVWDDTVIPTVFARDPGGASVSRLEDNAERIADNDLRESLNPAASAILVRGQRVALPAARDAYADFGLPADGDSIPLRCVLRYVLAQTGDAAFASREELIGLVPGTEPILTVREWTHTDHDEGEETDQVLAYRQIAEVLATGDPARYTGA